mmetsp:Transcript_24087/g.53365  ORF Transcript_24087/g.53365 Transcript_24087/m.53365 type:complete len:135 (-) Transcript_24087:898-1302(-)
MQTTHQGLLRRVARVGGPSVEDVISEEEFCEFSFTILSCGCRCKEGATLTGVRRRLAKDSVQCDSRRVAAGALKELAAETGPDLILRRLLPRGDSVEALPELVSDLERDAEVGGGLASDQCTIPRWFSRMEAKD